MRLVPETVLVWNGHPELLPLVLDRHARVGALQPLDLGPQRGEHGRPVRVLVRYDVQLRPVVLLLPLADLDPRARPPEDGEVRVAAARGRLEVPEHVQL